MKTMNNEGYRLYNEMINGYNMVNENKFVHGAMHFASMGLDHPFQNTEGDTYYGMMVICYKKWIRRGVDYRVNKRRLLHAAQRLCELDLPCPFEQDEVQAEGISYEQLQMDELMQAEAEDIASETYVPVYEPNTPQMHVLGVMPECEVE